MPPFIQLNWKTTCETTTMNSELETKLMNWWVKKSKETQKKKKTKRKRLYCIDWLAKMKKKQPKYSWNPITNQLKISVKLRWLKKKNFKKDKILQNISKWNSLELPYSKLCNPWVRDRIERKMLWKKKPSKNIQIQTSQSHSAVIAAYYRVSNIFCQIIFYIPSKCIRFVFFFLQSQSRNVPISMLSSFLKRKRIVIMSGFDVNEGKPFSSQRKNFSVGAALNAHPDPAPLNLLFFHLLIKEI